MQFRTSERFLLSSEEQRLLEWLYEHFNSGLSAHVFRAEDQTCDVRLEELQMTFDNAKAIAERLELWGREHWNLNAKPWSGTPPVRVERNGTQLKLIVMSPIVDIWLSYEDWLRQRQ
ncbi:MAG TPA: hypothetical protein PLU87_15190 [Sedimentisphaerales bacterium]|nr:hypothetical protein [Sedimentisphaerales bacterium]HRS12395.1 hypothetical protein [Sedimentisphaerales bacterium]HRV48963.1 hypothetical protein [Sedimentisphaerales bacterium]